LGAKKTKLGAKKVTTGADLDFDEAEKKAKEEAERIKSLGYDPDAEAAEDAGKGSVITPEPSSIVSPTPVSPNRSFGASSHSRQRSSQEVERLGMGVARLGFGQTGRPANAAPAPKKMGFGSVGASRPVAGRFSLILHVWRS
jgi:ADP-ribosylation factor GTPase-activating protein 2/3